MIFVDQVVNDIALILLKQVYFVLPLFCPQKSVFFVYPLLGLCLDGQGKQGGRLTYWTCQIDYFLALRCL